MKNVLPREALHILSNEQNAVLVDVRTPKEWNEGLPDTSNLELITLSPSSEEFAQLLEIQLSKDKKIFFICRGGVRSAVAGGIAESRGWKECYNISGGFIEWQNSNLPSKDYRAK